MGVAPAALLEAFDERLLGLGLRDLGEVRVGHEPHSGARGLGLANRHRAQLLQGREALEDRDALAGADLHDRLLPAARAAAGGAAALGLGLDAHRADLDDVDVEQRLDGLADLRLVGVGVDAEGVAVGGREHVALLRDDRADDHLGVLHQDSSPAAAPARGCAGARGQRLERGLGDEQRGGAEEVGDADVAGHDDATRARLRNDSAASDSSARQHHERRARLVPVVEQVERLARLRRREGAASRIASEPRSACSDSALRSAARCSLRLTLKV